MHVLDIRGALTTRRGKKSNTLLERGIVHRVSIKPLRHFRHKVAQVFWKILELLHFKNDVMHLAERNNREKQPREESAPMHSWTAIATA